jgi:1-acyl-sn-glycerol-3-phosphate acyltransferase
MRNTLSWLWYAFGSLLCYFILLLGCSMRVAGAARVPRRGPLLYIANHQSYLDPVLVGLASPRHLRYLARKGLFSNPVFAWFIRSLHAVPINQEGVAKGGLMTMLALLERGHACVMFPEGNRTPDGLMHEFMPGVQLLIKRGYPMVVPLGIAGAYDVLPRHRSIPFPAPLFMPATRGTIAVVVGRPIPSKQLVGLPRAELIKQLFDDVKDCYEKAERLRRRF